MPATVVITPLKVDECFAGFQSVLACRALRFEKVGDGYLVWKDDTRALFCEGGTGASNFADSSYVLCRCPSVKEIVFVGTGGGLGKDVQSADINVPPSCIRLDKVLEIFLPSDAPAEADPELSRELRVEVEKTVRGLGVQVHNGKHATVPFFLSETRNLLADSQRQGAISVDMELSVLYALANRYGKKAAGLIRIGDLPLRGLPTWKSRSYKRKLKKQVHTKILESVLNYIFGRS